jgi:hypothetical protein
MILYHGGTDIIEKPELRSPSLGRDFGVGFYCTDILDQAEKWAKRQALIRGKNAILNIYEFDLAAAQNVLNLKSFEEYSMEWLNLILKCRKDIQYIHGFDIVYGKIANDDVGETVQAVLDGLMPPDYAMQKLAFMQANSQYSFCTKRALDYLQFIKFKEAG